MTKPGEFYENILLLCMKHEGSITSGYRTPARNADVSGHPRSYHKLGLAFDVVLDSRDDVSKFMKDAQQLGVKAIDETDHIHCQPGA